MLPPLSIVDIWGSLESLHFTPGHLVCPSPQVQDGKAAGEAWLMCLAGWQSELGKMQI